MENKKKKHKLAVSAAALSMAAVIALGGTLAWQSTNQEALNEKMKEANPGGRLHDDFDGKNKDIYVENFSDPTDGGQPIFARVKLVEYMETGKDAGKNADKTKAERTDLTITTLSDTAEINDPATWTVYRLNDASNPFRQYWTLDTSGGKTKYMPTFNKNKDSLASDINGSYDKANQDGSKLHYGDYVDYSAADAAADKADTATYDVDDNDTEETKDTPWIAWDLTADANAQKPEGANVKLVKETHNVAETKEATKAITMAEWKKLDKDHKTGDFWVFDTDGWAYYANPINPGESSGLLLTQVTQQNILEKYYYSLTAIAQFCTSDDWGSTSGTGFYNTAKGTAPTDEARSLLETISGTQI